MYVFKLTFVIILFLTTEVNFLRSEVLKIHKISTKFFTFVSEKSPVKKEITFYYYYKIFRRFRIWIKTSKC